MTIDTKERLGALYRQQEALRGQLRSTDDPTRRQELGNALFELRCAIRVERERMAGVVGQCEGCGATARPTEWLEFCPECGGRWTRGR